MNYRTIGANIRRYRSFKGIKQDAFAKTLNLSRVMISRYENGHSKIEYKKLLLFAKALNVSVKELTGTSESKN
jgi:transcriptional regulator with XRE-family HTH domain